MKTSLFLKSAAVLLTALALGVFLFARVRVDAQAPAPPFDLLITNARVIDGSGNPWFRADVAIKDGRIARIGRLGPETAARTIDARGQILAPGFIDVHTHVESIYSLPAAENFVRMGVTTLVTGNCGTSATDVAEFLGRMKQTPLSVNLATLIAHGSVRRKVMGLGDREPTTEELKQMESIVEQGMKDGAVGLSTGLIYVPGTYAKTDEIVSLARVAARYGGLYATHMRNEGDKVADAIRESIQIGEQAGLPVEISHFKISNKKLWGQSPMTLGLVRDARARGLVVTVDQYAYTASSTSLDSRLPAWLRAGGLEEAKKRLADKATRERAIKDTKDALKRSGFKDYSFAVVASYGPDKSFNGKSIAEITKQVRKKNDVTGQIEQMLAMYEAGGAGMIYHGMGEDDVKRIMQEPFTMIASDSGVRQLDESVPHPRGYGNNARVLGHYVRELKLISLEDAIRKMTSLPAQTFGFRDRGLIREGFAADLVIFDENTIIDQATFDKPHQFPVGISYVIVNGAPVIENNQITAARPGVALRGPGSGPESTVGAALRGRPFLRPGRINGAATRCRPYKGDSMRHLKTNFFFLVLALLFSAAISTAQTVTGTLQGTVSDSTGAVLQGADVVIRNMETGQERNVKTNSEGAYLATFLPLGRYTVTASGAGFSKVAQENIEITLNQTRVINFTLNPSSVTEAVIVTAEAAPINTTNAEIKGSLNAQEILEKPTFNQGSFLTLAETFTGFQENPTSGQNNPTASSGSSINFNGTGTRGATFQINGVNNDDSSENQNRQGASLSTIKEFQVITNNFSAEFGRGYGAVVLVQTKSGTNNIHGDVYWYHNDSALNATNNVFSPGVKKGVTRRNQFGFTSGFPVFKDRLFSFISLDHTENSGANAYNRDVFTLAERNPANWFLQTPANNTPANRAFIQNIIDRFANAVPNDPAAGPRVFRGQQGFDFPARDYSGRLDWNAREADNFTARWQYTRQRFTADDIIPGERADQNHKQQNFGMTWTHLFSPTSVGEFRYGLGLRTTLVNIAAGNDTPIIRFFNPTPVTTQSSIGSAGNFPIQRYQTDNQFVYNFTTVFSTHQFRAGTDIRRQRLDDLADNFSRGFYSSTTATCNGINYLNGFNQFINGCTPNYQKGYGPFFLENRVREANFYGEDNWKVRPNLTLNLGLRYEYVSAPEEAAGRINYGIKADKDNIEPRFGFAWSPSFENGFMNRIFGNVGDSSFRGGYGIFHGRIFQSVFSQGGATVRFNPPNAFFYNQSGVATSTFNPVNLADPTNGFVFVPGPQTARHTITLIDPGLEMPYTQQWNLTFERQMPFASALRVSYTGNRGIGLLRYALDNLPLHDPVNGVLVANHPNNPANLRGKVIKLASDFLCAGTTGTTAIPFTAQCPNVVPIGEFEYSFRVPRTNERRPNGLYGTNLAVANAAWSYYHGMQVEWTKRLSRNLNFQAAYTWSKSIDTTSEATAVGAGDSNQNGNIARDARALSRFHTPHRFTVYGTYRLPFFSGDKGWLGQAFGGWQFSAVAKLAKGTPFTVTTTALDLNFDGFGESRPVILDPSILGRGVNEPASSRISLPSSAFRPLTIADFNRPILGRNTFFLDGVKNVDFGMTKIFSMPWEGHQVTLRADMFNVFNHVQYGFPSSAITNTNFGAITGVATSYLPRNIQVSLRYQY